MNLLVIKRKEIFKTHNIFVPFYPSIHFAPSYISYHMVNILQTNRFGIIIRFPFSKTWQKSSFIIFTFNKHMNGLTVRINTSTNNLSMLIFFNGGLHVSLCTSLCSLLICLSCIMNPQGYNFNTVTVLDNMVIDW